MVPDYDGFGKWVRRQYICGEPGWKEVALFTADWLDRTLGTNTATARPGEIRPSI